MLRRSLASAALCLCPLAAPAQGAPLDAFKRATPEATVRGTCSPVAPPRAPTDAQRRQARDLADRAQQAAILGDSAAARDQFRRAASLDPTDPDLAYRLARANETAGAIDEAAQEYCRFLALAPAAPEATEVRERVAVIARPVPTGTVQAAEATFRSGVAAYDKGEMLVAEAAFNGAIANQPGWADAYYDRALVHLKLGDRSAAISDFEQYLRLKPEASDRALVVDRINGLRRIAPSAANALALGLVIPGAGQFYTGRPVRGLVSLLVAGGAVAYGLQQRTRTVLVEQTATDPFGNPYTFTTSRPEKDRPNLVPGLAVAGVVTVAGAIEAYVFAHNAQSGGARVALSVTPNAAALSVRLSLR